MSAATIPEATQAEVDQLITPGSDIERPTPEVKPKEIEVSPTPTASDVAPANVIDAKDLLSGAESLPFVANDDAGEGEREISPKTGKPKRKWTKRANFADLEDITATEVIVDHKAMSVMLFDSSTGCLSMVLGEEWRPRSEEERNGMLGSIEAYLVATKAKDIPPGVMLTLVCLAYSAPRLQAPSTKSKLQLAWTWVKVKVVPFFRKKPKANNVAVQTNQTPNPP